MRVTIIGLLLIYNRGCFMWMETEDDLGNRGLAPYGTGLEPKNGSTPVRQIEIK